MHDRQARAPGAPAVCNASPRNAGNLRSRRAGFTLLELLVVVGIIVILIGILIPVIAKVRKSAYATSTQSRISVIAQAIQQYQQQFGGALPGPIPEAVLNSQPSVNSVALTTDPTVASPLTSGAAVAVTSSQNLVLGLLGGLKYNITANTFTYNPAWIGAGPQALSTTTAKQYTASMQFDPSTLNSGLISYLAANNAGSTAPEQIIPEFVDAYPDPMPILYMRASVGQTYEVEYNNSLGTTARSAQYNLFNLDPYLGPIPFTFNSSSFPPNTNTTTTGLTFDATNYPGSYNYFNNNSIPPSSSASNVQGTVHQKDSYILMSAGSDRTYGTSDDLNNFDFSSNQ